MNDVVNEARREYYRQWRAKNKDKTREYAARYWAKRAERMAQEQAAREVVKNDGKR
ncbi:phosphatase [uncultured Gemmiger sp.]|uniref:phosphatase n=1 Tax=uncultured Gemmiger sp. TaxID=1623490 RepID=UPI0025CBC64D|nr:phosphatase [uncultured Gemmiger sp.]